MYTQIQMVILYKKNSFKLGFKASRYKKNQTRIKLSSVKSLNMHLKA